MACGSHGVTKTEEAYRTPGAVIARVHFYRGNPLHVRRVRTITPLRATVSPRVICAQRRARAHSTVFQRICIKVRIELAHGVGARTYSARSSAAGGGCEGVAGNKSPGSVSKRVFALFISIPRRAIYHAFYYRTIAVRGRALLSPILAR